jgi:hypothetical protein
MNLIKTLCLVMSVFFLGITTGLSAQSEVASQWGEAINGFSACVEKEASGTLRFTGKVKFSGNSKKIELTESSLDWKVFFIADAPDQTSYQAEDSSWWDAYPHHKEKVFSEETLHLQDFDYSAPKWLFNAFDPQTGKMRQDIEQQKALPAGNYRIHLAFTALEPLIKADKTAVYPESGN